MEDNYGELLDYLGEWTGVEFFSAVISDNMEDEELKEKFEKAKKSFWDLFNYLDKNA